MGTRVQWVGQDARLPLTLKRFRKTRKHTQKRHSRDPAPGEGGGVCSHNSIFSFENFQMTSYHVLCPMCSPAQFDGKRLHHFS